MRKRGFPTVEPRPKLGSTTQHLGNGDNKGTSMRGETLARHSTKHNITISTREEGGTLVLEQFLEDTTTPLQGGGDNRQADLKIKGKYKQANTLGNLLHKIPRILSSPPAPKLAHRKLLARLLNPGTTQDAPIPETLETRPVRESNVEECDRANVEGAPPSCSEKLKNDF